MIKDSGARRTFASGAVRDVARNKGRCDLLPLDVVGDFFGRTCGNPVKNSVEIFKNIALFQESGLVEPLYEVLRLSSKELDFECFSGMFLEVARHMEESSTKYPENNWRKGIPTKCYIDSAVRHLLKYLRGDADEPHNRAFVWNIMCCIWTCIHKPELNDYKVAGETTTDSGDKPTTTEKYPVTKFLKSMLPRDENGTRCEVDWNDVIEKMWEAGVFYD